MFSDPNLIGKLATNPRTSKHFADPAFVQKLQMIQQNPKLADQALSGDARMIDVLGVLMGIDMQGFTREEGSNEPPQSSSDGQKLPDEYWNKESEPSPPAAASSSSAAKPTEPEPAKAEDTEMEDDEDTKLKKEAEAEKKLGSDAYRTRDFAAAATHFLKAWEIWPKDLTFLTNLGGE